MTQLAELRAASFRGVRFLIGDVSTTGGRKQVVHEFQIQTDVKLMI